MNVSPCQHGVNDSGGLGAVNHVVRMRDITDGTSNTVAVDELRGGLNDRDLRGSWAMPGLGSGTAALFNDGSVPNSKEPQSDDMENCAVAGLLGIPPMGCFDSTSTGQMTARSLHTGGIQALLADGSVRFISDNIDSSRAPNDCGPADQRGVWQKIHTRSGGEVVGEF